MRRVCAWCGDDLAPKTSSQVDNENAPITHGICVSCKTRLRLQSGVPLKDYIDTLEAPVVVLNADSIVTTANNKALSLLSKNLPEVSGYRGGDVFECVNAQLPEGCGHTIHCVGCTIRRAVMETHATGKSVVKSPAFLNRRSVKGPRKIDLLISTEKIEDVVFLRIDDVEN